MPEAKGKIPGDMSQPCGQVILDLVPIDVDDACEGSALADRIARLDQGIEESAARRRDDPGGSLPRATSPGRTSAVPTRSGQVAPHAGSIGPKMSEANPAMKTPRVIEA